MNGVEYSETIRTREGERERERERDIREHNNQRDRQVGRERQREHSEGIDRSMDGWKNRPAFRTSDRTIEWNERSILGSS